MSRLKCNTTFHTCLFIDLCNSSFNLLLDICLCMFVCVCVHPDYQSDSDSFNPTLWEEQRQQRMTVAFDFEDKKDEEDNSGKVKVSFLSPFLLACLSVQRRMNQRIKTALS